MPFGLRPWHIIAIVVVALIIFGPSRLPQLGKGMGKFFKDLREGAKDMSSGFKEGLSETESSASAASASAAEAAKTSGAAPAAGAPGADGEVPPPAKPTPGNFCIACGAPNPPAARFCNACGSKIKG